MDSQRIAEIKGWMTYERELYTRFCEEKNEEALHLTRARVFFMTMRDLPELLKAVEERIKTKIPKGTPQGKVRRGMARSGKALYGKARQGKSKTKGGKKK
jgi:hypothetical protein